MLVEDEMFHKSEQTSMELGRAMVVAEKHYRELSSKNESGVTGSLAQALRTLHNMLSNHDSKEKTAMEIITSLLQRIPSNKSNSRKSAPFSLLCYLIESHNHLFSSIFQHQIQHSNHKIAYQISEFLYQLVEAQRTFLLITKEIQTNKEEKISEIRVTKRKEKKITASMSMYMKFVLGLFPVLVNTSVETSSQNTFNKKAPTRVSLSLLNTAMNITRFSSVFYCSTGNINILSVFLSAELEIMLELYKSYYSEHFPLFGIAVLQIKEIVGFFANYLQESYRDVVDAFCIRWEEYASIILSTPRKKLPKVQHATLRYSLRLINTKEVQSDPFLMHHYILCVALLLGRLKSWKGVLSDLQEFSFLSNLQFILIQCSNEKLHQIAPLLFQRTIQLLTDPKEWEGHIEKLFLLLEQQDILSDSILEVLSFSIQNNGAYYLPRLFNNLHNRNNDLKKNSLRLLGTLLRATHTGGRDVTGSVHYQRQIVTHVLQHAADLSVELRKEAQELLNCIAPSISIVCVVEAMHREWNSSDARLRSILYTFYKNTLLQSTYPLESIESVLYVLRHTTRSHSATAIALPSDIDDGTNQEESNSVVEMKKELLKPVAEWTKNLPTNRTQKFLHFVFHSFFDHPGSTEMVSFVSQCSDFLGIHAITVISMINTKLQAKHAPTTIDNLFDHLAPLLLLRVLPLHAYQTLHESRELKTLQSLLWQIFVDKNEFKELRQVSTEILARFLPSCDIFEEIVALLYCESEIFLKILNSVHGVSFDTAKLCIFYLCNTLSIYCPYGERYANTMLSLFDHLYQMLSTPANNEEIQKLQQGCIDAAGVLFQNALFMENDLYKHLFEYLFKDEVERNTSKLASAIISLIPSWKGKTSSKFTSLALPRVLSILYTQLQTKNTSLTTVTLLQVVFVTVYHAKDSIDEFISDLFQCSQDACNHSLDKVRLGGLKVLGALMKTESFENLLLQEENMNKLSFLLENLSNIETSAPVRQLADKLLSTMTTWNK